MPCYGPVRVAIDRKPTTPNGHRTRDTQTVPCGHCLGCRAEQGRQWAVRMMHEAQMHTHAWFLTLTYDDDHLPEKGTLVPEHPKGFIKSLRRDLPPRSLSYFLCGEYGDLRSRPHYHAILFGPDLPDRLPIPHRSGPPVWTSRLLDRHWGMGLTEFSSVTMGSASYVAGYVQKKAIHRENDDLYTRVDPDTGELHQVQPEFARMSRNPAIGRRWIEKYWPDVYPRDFVVVDGHECKPPRYYDKWLEEHHPHVSLKVRESRWNPDYDDSQYKRDARAQIHRAKLSLHSNRNAF